MSLLSRAQELEDISDAQLAQLVQQGSEAGDTFLAATETERRLNFRERYEAEEAKQQAANPPDIMTERLKRLGGGIPSADPNIDVPPDPSLQTGIAGPPQGGPPQGGPPQGGPPPGMASGGAIRGYQTGGGVGDPVRPRDTRESIAEYDKLLDRVRQTQQTQASAGITPVGSAEEEAERLWQQGLGASDVGFGWGAQTPTTTADVVTAERAAASELKEIERVSARLMALNPDMDPAEAARRAGADVDSDAITFDPDTGRAMRDGEFYSPEDDRLGSNMVQLLKMKAAAIAANDPDELRKVEAGIAELQSSLDRRLGGQEIDADGVLGWEDFAGLGDPVGGDALSRLRGIRDVYRSEMRDTTPADEAAARLRMSAADERQRRARGIHTLRGGRRGEQERILKHRLGLSEEAVREMRSEMYTPEQTRNLRKAAAFGGLSSMFLDPNLRTGIGGMGDKLTATDTMLRAERKSALEKIRAERKDAGLLEQQGLTGIFDTRLLGQQGLDTAELARLDLDYDVAQGLADREHAGAGTIADMGMKIEGMAFSEKQAIAAAHRAAEQAWEESQQASESYILDPSNHENIMKRYEDIINYTAGMPDDILSEEQKVRRIEQTQRSLMSMFAVVDADMWAQIQTTLGERGVPTVDRPTSVTP